MQAAGPAASGRHQPAEAEQQALDDQGQRHDQHRAANGLRVVVVGQTVQHESAKPAAADKGGDRGGGDDPGRRRPQAYQQQWCGQR